mmetsp:Transcript_127213/g.302177  ORF Transcript_127213/g.302177 Transcript_127213/m.302177 type:complete len:192 (-) Transcript_127213:216-791(-)
MPSRGESNCCHRPVFVLPDQAHRCLEIGKRIFEAMTWQKPIAQHQCLDSMPRQPSCNRQPFIWAEKLVVPTGTDDDSSVACQRLLAESRFQQTRNVRTMEEWVFRQPRQSGFGSAGHATSPRARMANKNSLTSCGSVEAPAAPPVPSAILAVQNEAMTFPAFAYGSSLSMQRNPARQFRPPRPGHQRSFGT